MNQYERLGHMTRQPVELYFNGSAKTTLDYSLNDILKVGPIMQMTFSIFLLGFEGIHLRSLQILQKFIA